jgi:hypothetical protein
MFLALTDWVDNSVGKETCHHFGRTYRLAPTAVLAKPNLAVCGGLAAPDGSPRLPFLRDCPESKRRFRHEPRRMPVPAGWSARCFVFAASAELFGGRFEGKS